MKMLFGDYGFAYKESETSTVVHVNNCHVWLSTVGEYMGDIEIRCISESNGKEPYLYKFKSNTYFEFFLFTDCIDEYVDSVGILFEDTLNFLQNNKKKIDADLLS